MPVWIVDGINGGTERRGVLLGNFWLVLALTLDFEWVQGVCPPARFDFAMR